ncbi:MAG: EamA family transporter [Clostridium sp.]|nr:EamA family transporter [Clostridium sp.]
MKDIVTPILYALLAALFYAVNTPLSKLLLVRVPSTFMAAFLYMGAGVGVGIMYVFHWKKEEKTERLGREDYPYTIGMIVLDILAPIFLMLGIKYGTAANASLLGNFEIVATTLIAFVIFRETVSKRLWTAIAFITISSIILSSDGAGSFRFSYGSLFVLLATVCWGLENNCTRSISDKSTYEIVVLKGIFSGGGAFVIALLVGERLPALRYIVLTMLLGFTAYGLSIFLYIRAQKSLGAAKTSAYYAVAPFVGTFLSFVLLGEKLTWSFLAALLMMVAGTVFVVLDTTVRHHEHQHTHTFVHTHNGITHNHTVVHSHAHNHYTLNDRHGHHHSRRELEAAIGHFQTDSRQI